MWNISVKAHQDANNHPWTKTVIIYIPRTLNKNAEQIDKRNKKKTVARVVSQILLFPLMMTLETAGMTIRSD